MGRGRSKLVVDPVEFQGVIDNLEKDGPFKTMGKLFEAVEETDWAKNLKNESGNIHPLSAQVAYLRYKDFDLDSKTKSGKRGRKVSAHSKDESIDPQVVKDATIAQSVTGAVRVTRIPAGECPVKLKGVDKDTVFKWCDDIQDFFKHKDNSFIATEGLAYFVHHNFYDPLTNDEEYYTVLSFIMDWYDECSMNTIDSEEKEYIV